jgi:hypothetical protein
MIIKIFNQENGYMKRTISRVLLPVIIIGMLAWVPFPAQADGGDDEFTQTVNGYQVALVFAEDPTVGENQIHIQIHDAMDMPVHDASVEVILAPIEDRHSAEASESSSHEDLDASEASGHEGMPGMDMTAHESTTAHEMQGIALEPAVESGEYSGDIHIESTGEWVISVQLTVKDEVMKIDFPLTVKSNSRNGILAGFVGTNLLILIVAAALKSKSASQ